VRTSFVSLRSDRLVLAQIGQLIDEGEVLVIVSGEVPLSNAGQALAESRKGHVVSKIVLITSGSAAGIVILFFLQRQIFALACL
jgi:NADPH:quinone reductase-like Zn-dependent oxidoreductase